MTKEENMEHILDDIIFDNNPVVVGVSSGPDSMCLLNLLEQKTNKLVVCHINHNVRKESTTEEEYLKDYCQKHNLIFESMKITEYKETNFENEARKKRYNFYEEILSKYHSTKLFLAHHGDDQIETVLMKIVRGSNLEGYAGIKEISKVKNYQIIRPLLKVTKEDIINYNKSHNITYFIDSSNTNIDYTRNWYRHKVLPILKERKKDIHLSFLKYSETLQEYNEYIERTIQEKIPNIYQNNTINIKTFQKTQISKYH
jgi:tRNA(Ile)-lysidine synthetase-like protein